MTARAFSGRRVLVTRALDDARRWAPRIAALGAEPVLLPCVSSEWLEDVATGERLAAALGSADWLLFTSVRGAEAVSRIAPGIPARTRIGAVGESTADAARRLFSCIPFVAHGGTSRALGDELVAFWGGSATGRRVVVAGAAGGRDDAEQALEAAGAQVTRVAVYRTSPAAPRSPRRDLTNEGITDVLLASPSAVTGLLNQAVVSTATRVFTIGPTTSAAAMAAGLAVAGESATPDLEGLMEAMQCTIGA